jgi:hypothetical protein
LQRKSKHALVQREVFGHKGKEVWNETGKNFVIRSFMISYLTYIILLIKSKKMGWADHLACTKRNRC